MRTRTLLLISLVFSLPLLFDMLGRELPGGMIIMLVLSTPVVIGVGSRFHKSAWAALMNRYANMDTLISLGTLTAYFYSIYSLLSGGEVYFEIAAFLIFFILLGQYFEELSKGRASRAMEELINLQPQNATVINGNKEKTVVLDELSVGDIILVKPGERVPVDGEIIDGESSIDESMVTGESMPSGKKLGDKVIGATINKHGSFKFRATKVGTDTVLAQIIEMVRRAQTTKAPIQRIADNISSYFVPSVIVLAIITFNVWFVIIDASFVASLLFAVSVVVIACPCALGLATPMALLVGSSRGAKAGILIKSGEVLESAHGITHVAFDKTGTLTEGKPVVTKVVGENPSKVLEVAASLEALSEHPLASSIINRAKNKNIKTSEVKNFIAHEGKGVSGEIGGKAVFVGKPNRQGDDYREQFKTLVSQGNTVVGVELEGKTIGLLVINDIPKLSAKEALKHLHDSGLKTVMITGDNLATGEAIAKQLGIDEVIAEVLPQDKVNKVKDMQQNSKVAFVGDGINDAPALAQADLGIAMGSGTDVAAESGGIVLMRNDMRDVGKALKLSDKTFQRIKLNLGWAFGYNLAAIPIAAGVFSGIGITLNPALAGLAMGFSSVSVVLSSLMLNIVKID